MKAADKLGSGPSSAGAKKAQPGSQSAQGHRQGGKGTYGTASNGPTQGPTPATGGPQPYAP